MKIKLIISFIFFPFSVIWKAINRLRRYAYSLGYLKSYNFNLPIISVGNVVFGGTGKTPFTIWLAKFLESEGKVITVLLRGYKGKLEKLSGLLKSENKFNLSALDFGDEAINLIRSLEKSSVIVGKNRKINFVKFADDVKADVLLLDDGYQHLQIFRDLDIVLFDANLPLESYKVVPSGYMREGIEALNYGDVIIITRCD